MKKILLFVLVLLFGSSLAQNRPSLFELIYNEPDFRLYAKALELVGYAEMLKNEGSYTLLIPMNAALDELLALFDEPEKLKEILSLHIIMQALTHDELSQQSELETLGGTIITVRHSDGIQLNHAHVFGQDVLASNGIGHFIDQIITTEN